MLMDMARGREVSDRIERMGVGMCEGSGVTPKKSKSQKNGPRFNFPYFVNSFLVFLLGLLLIAGLILWLSDLSIVCFRAGYRVLCIVR